MTDDTKPTPNTALIERLRPSPRTARALRRAKTIASKTFAVVQDKASTHIQPRLEEAVERWTQPEHLESLQTVLATTAQWGFKLGFANDPRAKRLFDFASYIEDIHGRRAVLMALAQFNPILDGSLVDLLQARYAAWPKINQTAYDAQMERVRLSFLHLLCALARLEDAPDSDRRVPPEATVEMLVDFFHDSALPEQFMILAGLAAGHDDAFATFDGKTDDNSDGDLPPEGEDESFLGKLKAVLMPNGDPDAQEEQREQDPRANALATNDLKPFDVDPKFQFLVNSYTFFLQTYTTRALVEVFPDLIGWAKSMDKQQAAQRTAQSTAADDESKSASPDVMDVIDI